jgi:DNA-binding SARP family transcriptional activator
VELEAWPWPIKVYTLGRFDVLRDDEAVQVSGKVQKRPLALLRALIALGGEQVREERLADVLWPETDGDAAQQALSVTLHRLRRFLGNEDAVRRQAGCLSLDRRRCWSDVAALDRILSHAEGLCTNGSSHHWAEAARWTDRAVQLYTGDFLADDPDFPWATPFAERLRERLLRQVRKLAQHWEQNADWVKAAECYKRALDINACSEECCRALMKAYERLGRRDEAFAAYQRCARHLTEQLGIHPSTQTLALIESLKSGA